MKKYQTFALVSGLGLALTMAGAVFAADVLPKSSDSLSIYKEVGDWTIYSDATRGSCLAERVDTVGNAMQMGMTKDNYGYVGVFTQAETDIKKSQPIEIAVDGKLFVGESQGVRSKKLANGYSGGYIVTNNPDLVNAIANGKEMVAFPEKTGVFVINLTGTKRAIEEIATCNASLGS